MSLLRINIVGQVSLSCPRLVGQVSLSLYGTIRQVGSAAR